MSCWVSVSMRGGWDNGYECVNVYEYMYEYEYVYVYEYKYV